MPANKGGLAKSEKRMHTVRWMSQAWKDFQATELQLYNTAAFFDTGILIACDGSADDLIRLWPKADMAEQYAF